MSNSRRLVLPGHAEPGQLILPGQRTANHRVPVRNLLGKEIPCCHGPCDGRADDRYRVEIPHSQPRWKDENTGRQEMVIYTFCSPLCRTEFLKGSPYADR